MKERGQERQRGVRKRERDGENKHSLRHEIRFRESQKQIKGDKADLSAGLDQCNGLPVLVFYVLCKLTRDFSPDITITGHVK